VLTCIQDYFEAIKEGLTILGEQLRTTKYKIRIVTKKYKGLSEGTNELIKTDYNEMLSDLKGNVNFTDEVKSKVEKDTLDFLDRLKNV
jgi:hypothetical protein